MLHYAILMLSGENKMPKETVLIVGLGEVGHSLYDLFKESGKFDVYGHDVDKAKIRAITGKIELPKKVDVMHTCIPCVKQDKFSQATVE